MIKTLAKAQQQERVKFRVPRSVQDAIPIRRIWSDGIFLCGNQYSKTWSFTDINYAIAGKGDKTAMFLDYSELLNALDSGAWTPVPVRFPRAHRPKTRAPAFALLSPDRPVGQKSVRPKDLPGWSAEFQFRGIFDRKP